LSATAEPAAVPELRPVVATGRREWTKTVGLTVGLVIIIGLLLAGYLLPLRYGPNAISESVLKGPSSKHWFGTNGRSARRARICPWRLREPRWRRSSGSPGDWR
jgi:hypothetical protein